jgi:NADPH-dependent FMN reductase
MIALRSACRSNEPMAKQLLIVWDSMTGGSAALAQAAENGARTVKGVDTVILNAAKVGAADMQAANGYIFVCPENLAAISGVMKAFFDRNYYPCLGALEGRSYAVMVCAGSDGSNAVRQIERIATGWRLRRIAGSRIIVTNAQTSEQILAPKIIADNDLADAKELGAGFAEGLLIGIY